MAHSHQHQLNDSRSGRRLTIALLIPAIAATVIGMLALWPSSTPDAPAAGQPVRVLGEVTAVSVAVCPEGPTPEDPQTPEAGTATTCGTATVKLTDGPDTGATVTADLPFGPGAIDVTVGDEIVLLKLMDDQLATQSYSIMDHQRSTPLWLLGLAFAVAVIAFGRWRGLTALAGLGLTFVVLLLFIVPAILDGQPPLLVAIVGAAAIMLTVLYLTHGFNLTTTIAVAGTLAAITLTAVLSAVATAVTHLSGVADETSNYLTITQGDVDMRGLLLAGIVIGALGVLDDVTVTQSVTVAELSVANPAYGFKALYRSATRIGRAHIASVINTIVLAYAGASLPMMLLFATGGTPVGELLTGELIAQEVVRSVVGTIGLICAVPITTALAAALASRNRKPAADPSATRTAVAAQPVGPSIHPRPATDPWAAFVEGRGEDDRRHW
ncbi:hypothetical protein GCM10027290_03290 [Micromonospora sonneratiae]|uniref:YibE/F family protein n=1 Tax=Micromonospora sonneratiae TaxID=1184706 RepID=A0ABW3Y7A4_9ACTN